ncbi:MAG TPA: hypothetical protein PK987_12885 [Ferruginibacter sp.]|nr:hypothetical protein [Ferruginibacter sp.]
MRFTLVFAIIVLLFAACKKDKFTTAPQISFKSYNPDQGSNYSTNADEPVMTLEITDAEGDLGFIAGSDTAKIYIKNLLTSKEDSLIFPDLSAAGKSNFKAEIELGLLNVMGGRNLPVNQRPYLDTLYFEVYVTDFAKNKSNILVTSQPFFYFSLP